MSAHQGRLDLALADGLNVDQIVDVAWLCAWYRAGLRRG